MTNSKPFPRDREIVQKFKRARFIYLHEWYIYHITSSFYNLWYPHIKKLIFELRRKIFMLIWKRNWVIKYLFNRRIFILFEWNLKRNLFCSEHFYLSNFHESWNVFKTLKQLFWSSGCDVEKQKKGDKQTV